MWVLGISIRGTGRRLHILNGMFRFESNNRRECARVSYRGGPSGHSSQLSHGKKIVSED